METKEIVKTNLQDYLMANGFSNCAFVGDDSAALCLEKIDCARLQVKLMQKGIVVEIYAEKGGVTVWERLGKNLVREAPLNGCAFEEVGPKVLEKELDDQDALIIRYATGIDWQSHELSNAEKLKICEAAKELLCRIV